MLDASCRRFYLAVPLVQYPPAVAVDPDGDPIIRFTAVCVMIVVINFKRTAQVARPERRSKCMQRITDWLRFAACFLTGELALNPKPELHT